MVEDDDWPGRKYRGATWVQYFGGPWDGTFLEIKSIPLQLLGKINVLPKGVKPGDVVEPYGAYHPTGWEDEDLKIVRLEWRPARRR